LIHLLDLYGLFPGVVLDVGANTGQTLLELFGTGVPIKRYYGFEPNPAAFSIVKRLVSLNPAFACVDLLSWACSDVDAPVRFYAIAETDTGATFNPSIRPNWYSNMAGTFAPSYRLDSVARQMELCHHFFLKIDVEGGELQVLQGAAEVLGEWRPIIQCEVLHAHRVSELEANDRHKADVASLLSGHDYLIFQCQLSESGTRLASLLRMEAFPSSSYSKSPQTCDYLFLPHELKTRLFP